jgi:hypothetical protein
MPYVQVGSKLPEQDGWYTTQAFLLASPFWSDVDSVDFMWLPSFTWVDPDAERPRADHVTLGGGLGRSDGGTVVAFTASFGVEFFCRGAVVR